LHNPNRYHWCRMISFDQNENNLLELNNAMLDASHIQDGGKIAEISKSMHLCRTEIETLFNELEKLTATLEEKRTAFDDQLILIDRSE